MSQPDPNPGAITATGLSSLIAQMAEHTRDAVLITEGRPIDGEGPRILYVNPAFTRMTGYTADEVLGHTPRLLQGPRTSRAELDRLRTALENWQPVRVELLNLRKDGSEFWVELDITPVTGPSGWFEFWLSVQRESSERQRFDEQRRLYELILAHVDQGIVVADALRPDWPIEFVNAGFTRITGYSAQETLGRNCRFLQGPGSEPEARARLRHAIEHSEPVTVEMLNYRKDGSEFPVMISLSPLRDARGKVIKYAAVQRDLTETRRREKEMVSAQRLKAVGEMTGGIAHDFNNLLTSISGSAELLARRLAHDPDLSELVQSISRAAEGGAGHVRRLLGFSRTTMLARGPVDLRLVLDQLELLLSRSLRDDVQLQIQRPLPVRWVDAEAVQLEAALLNLVLNAQDAMPRGGRIDLSVSSPVLCGEDAWVDIEVADTGSGMGPQTLSRIFEPFFTTKEPGKGSGLGLAMVKAFVEQLGGRISVVSQPDEGTRFTLTLKAAAEASRANATPLDAADKAPTQACRVLMVEDDEVVRLIGRNMLEALGHTVVPCSQAQEALDRLAAGETFDLLFTDLMMPGGMDGLELAATVKRLSPQMAVVLASGWADSKLPQGAGHPDFATFLQKPYRMAELEKAFDAALGRVSPAPS